MFTAEQLIGRRIKLDNGDVVGPLAYYDKDVLLFPHKDPYYKYLLTMGSVTDHYGAFFVTNCSVTKANYDTVVMSYPVEEYSNNSIKDVL